MGTSVSRVVFKGKHEKDDMYIASVEKFMLGFTFSLSTVCGKNSNRDTPLIGPRSLSNLGRHCRIFKVIIQFSAIFWIC